MLKEKWLWLAILVYFVVLGTTSCLRHYNFQTQTWDLAPFVQSFWNTAHGRVMANNLEEAPNHFGVHMAPWLLVLVPGFAIWPSPYYLLLIQTLALALAAWPLFYFSKEVLASRQWAYAITLGYLLSPSLHWLNSFDFHEEPFFVPLFLAAFYFLESRRLRPAALFLALAALTKENAILVVAAAGVYLAIRSSEERKLGLITVCISLIYFFVSVTVVMPTLGGGLLRLDRYANLGDTPAGIARNILADPGLLTRTIFTAQKLSYLLWVFLPVAFLPLASWSALFLIGPGLAQNLLTTFEFQFSGLYQYEGIVLPGVFIAAVYGLRACFRQWPGREKLIMAVLAAALSLSFLFRSPVSPLHFPTKLFGTTERWQDYRELLKLVPPGISVAAQTNLVPHLATRELVYMLGREPSDTVDMVLVDGTSSFGFESTDSFQQYISSYEQNPDYRYQVIKDRYIIFSRKPR